MALIPQGCHQYSMPLQLGSGDEVWPVNTDAMLIEVITVDPW